MVIVAMKLIIMFGCESWTIKKTEHQRIDAFDLWAARARPSWAGCPGDGGETGLEHGPRTRESGLYRVINNKATMSFESTSLSKYVFISLEKLPST